jgi:hypothetical protein
MNRVGAWLLQLLASACLGVGMSVLLAAVCLLANRDRRCLGAEFWFDSGRIPWLVARHEGFGTWWVNATRLYEPLLGEVPNAFAPPAWARDMWGPTTALPGSTRLGALAGGWPLPAIGQAWITNDSSEIFPPTAEFDMTGAVMDMARDRMGDAGLLAIRFIPIGLALDALPWFALSLWLLRRRTGRVRVNPQAAAATPPAPAP